MAVEGLFLLQPMDMTRNEILRRWPNAVESFIKANLDPVEVVREVPDAKPKHHKKAALGSAIPREEKSLCRPRVCFTLYRVKLLDPDNAAGSVKDLLDGLRHAGLIEGDEWYSIKLEVEQEKVAHYHQEGTMIEIFKL